MADEFVILMIF